MRIFTPGLSSYTLGFKYHVRQFGVSSCEETTLAFLEPTRTVSVLEAPNFGFDDWRLILETKTLLNMVGETNNYWAVIL